ncbi:MAG: histone-lysine N-methyltransferase [Candidatus Desantisbacteria bacterium]
MKLLRQKKPLEYLLSDVKEPMLFREQFPYTEVPKILFDGKDVPISPPEEILITDTTFRDGQQARPPYTPKQIADIYTFFHRLGGPNGIIRQSEFFLYSEKDREAVQMCKGLGFKYPEITGWIRANKQDFKLVKEMGLSETGILTSVSDYHIFLKLNKKRSEALSDYLKIVESALEAGIVPRCHLEDITRADFYGLVIPFVQALMELSSQAKIPVKIRACDTMGLGVPYPSATLPRSVPKIIWGLVNEGAVPSSQLEWHGHNDFHKVHINAVTAWLYGATFANSTILGFGERTGNSPLEALVIEYISLTGSQAGIETTVITEIAEYFEKEIGFHIPPTYPFVGLEFNVTKAGIHVDGISKDEEIYNIFDTQRILNRPLKVAITDKSGLSGISYWINSYLKLEGGRRIDKRHPGIIHIQKWIDEEYKEQRITSISDEEMIREARKHLPNLFESDFDLLKKRAYSEAKELIERLVEEEPIRSGDVPGQEKRLGRFIEENPFIQFIYITNLRGVKITKNITHPQDIAKYEGLKEEESFAGRDWFTEPLSDGKTYCSDFYTSKFTKKLCITVSTPIRNTREEIIGILGADIMFEELARLESEG